MERECGVVCRTIYYGEEVGTIWHDPFPKVIKIVSKIEDVEGFALPISCVEYDGKSFPIIRVRGGLEGKVIAICILDEQGREVALYTDILTERGKASDPSFLEEARSGRRQRREEGACW